MVGERIVFVSKRVLSKCFDYDALVSECLELVKGYIDQKRECHGWSMENYSMLDAIWNCLLMPEKNIDAVITMLCEKLANKSETAREICKQYGVI